MEILFRALLLKKVLLHARDLDDAKKIPQSHRQTRRQPRAHAPDYVGHEPDDARRRARCQFPAGDTRMAGTASGRAACSTFPKSCKSLWRSSSTAWPMVRLLH